MFLEDLRLYRPPRTHHARRNDTGRRPRSRGRRNQITGIGTPPHPYLPQVGEVGTGIGTFNSIDLALGPEFTQTLGPEFIQTVIGPESGITVSQSTSNGVNISITSSWTQGDLTSHSVSWPATARAAATASTSSVERSRRNVIPAASNPSTGNTSAEHIPAEHIPAEHIPPMPVSKVLPEVIPEDTREIAMGDKECAVCMTHPSNVVAIVDCGHTNCCNLCLYELEQCPICRVRITKAIRIFTS